MSITDQQYETGNTPRIFVGPWDYTNHLPNLAMPQSLKGETSHGAVSGGQSGWVVYGDAVDCTTKLGRILGFTPNSGLSEIKDSYFGKIHLIYGNLRVAPPNKALERVALGGGTLIFQCLIEKTNPTSSLQLRFEALYTKKSNISYQTSTCQWNKSKVGFFEMSTWYQGKATDLLPGKLKFPSPPNRKSWTIQILIGNIGNQLMLGIQLVFHPQRISTNWRFFNHPSEESC